MIWYERAGKTLGKRPVRPRFFPNKSFGLAGANGVTYRDTEGNLRVYVLRPQENVSNDWPLDFVYPTFGSFLSGMVFGPTTNRGTVSAHDFGHARYLMDIGGNGAFNQGSFNDSALELENLARRAHDPNSPIRVKH